MTLSYHGQGDSDKNDWKMGWNIARGQCFYKTCTSVAIVFTLFSSSYPSSSLNVEDNYNTMASITNQKDSRWYILTMDLLMRSLLRGIDKGTWGSGRFAWSWFNQSWKQ